MNKQNIAMGLVDGPHGTDMPAALHSEALLREIFGVSPVRRRMMGLAGPNETLQWLLDAMSWTSLLSGFVGAVLAKGLDRALDAAYEKTLEQIRSHYARLSSVPLDPDKTEAILQIPSAVRETQVAGNTVIFGIPLGNAAGRNAGVQLPQIDEPPTPEQLISIARAMLTLATIGEALAEFDAQHPGEITYAMVTNSDCSIAIEDLGGTGYRVNLFLHAGGRTLIFDTAGKLIDVDVVE